MAAGGMFKVVIAVFEKENNQQRFQVFFPAQTLLLCLMAVVEAAQTPMMKQWSELKAQAGSALLFFRLGDFYELFGEDATQAAPVLGVTLTSRNSKSPDALPLCGVPVANVEPYIAKALNHGFRIALAEQVEEPQKGKTLVRREIVQYFSPGIRLLQNEQDPHYLGVAFGSERSWVLAAADVATGHVLLERGTSVEQLRELLLLLPVEDLRLLSHSHFLSEFSEAEIVSPVSAEESENFIRDGLSVSSLQDLDFQSRDEKIVLGLLLKILQDAHPRDELRFLPPRRHSSEVWMTAATKKNLYLFEPHQQSLFHFMDQTMTALGRRELRFLLNAPTQDAATIQRRQELIRVFGENPILRQRFRFALKNVLDLHRLLRRRRGPFELFQLCSSLHGVEQAAEVLKAKETAHPQVASWLRSVSELHELSWRLRRTLRPSDNPHRGWVQEGVSKELDELQTGQRNSTRLLSELEENLRKEFGISSLKIKFHQVLGYVIEVTNTHKDKIPTNARSLQILANVVRFKTEKLEELEEKILSLQTRLKEAEDAFINQLYEDVFRHRPLILQMAEELGSLDAFQALAEVSAQNNWTTPTLATDTQVLKFRKASHPLSSKAFVPLDLELDSENLQVLLLTGPNMSGKSTLLRLAATIAYLHQIGSDVPAASAHLSIFDRIVCRMGATDDLQSGQSTFFVEMREVSAMLHGASERSLLIFDEIGRGTSTFDGMSLAWAITEDVHQRQSLCLMATHYLELAELERNLSRLKSFHLGIREKDGQLIFTRQLLAGPASRSYGIEVAKLAHLPLTIVERARMKLKDFETRRRPMGPLFDATTNTSETRAS